MLEWHKSAVVNRDDPSACIVFTRRFLDASLSERSEVLDKWESRLKWSLPNPWRLACVDEGPGTTLERIRTTLLFQALSQSTADSREGTMVLAVVHNSCRLAGLDARGIFEEVARAVGGAAADAIMRFANRGPADQSMEAFMLSAVENSAGGYELTANW